MKILKFHQKLTLTAVSVFALLAFSSTGQTQTPIYELLLNGDGVTEPSTGSATHWFQFNDATSTTAINLRSGPGTGVSGLPGDRAFDNTASTRMGGTDATASGGAFRLSNDNYTTLNSLTSFTLQGWYQVGPDVTGDYANASLVRKGTGTTNQFDLRLSRTGGNTNLSLALGTPTRSLTTVFSSTNSLLGEDGWVFFAVTYDSTLASNNVKFYAGTTDDSVVLISQSTLLSGALGDSSTYSLGFGNRVFDRDRPFDGYMDNLRVFGTTAGDTGALSLEQLESFRSLDAIPEPGTAGLILLGLAAFASVRRTRNSRSI